MGLSNAKTETQAGSEEKILKSGSKNVKEYLLKNTCFDVSFKIWYKKAMFFKISAFIMILNASAVFADAPTPSARRIEGQTIHYYAALSEAFEAASGISADQPDEITVLSDIILDKPIIIDTVKHIRLVAADGNRTIQRGSENPEYPLFWLTGDSATLTMGKPNMENELIIDGGYLNIPPIEAFAPLIAVNGRDSKLIMYDNVFVQNNYSKSIGAGTSLYQNGAGVFIRTTGDDFERQAEFIMKGGIIRGNINDVQTPLSCGGGVLIASSGLFTMEGGSIMNNTAFRSGGGFHTGSRGSFKKTGGIIYGSDAPAGYRNTVIHGTGSPKVFGHAVCVALVDHPPILFRDDTVRENDSLSYVGSPTVNGVFGQGEKWTIPKTISYPWWLIVIASVLAFGGGLFFLTVKRKQQAIPAENTAAVKTAVDLSPREREIFDYLLTELSTKEIAQKMELTYSGVNFHIQKLYAKLGVQSRTELLARFITPPTLKTQNK
jgi:DNA-binding CsgD family transcriptional regulator